MKTNAILAAALAGASVTVAQSSSAAVPATQVVTATVNGAVTTATVTAGPLPGGPAANSASLPDLAGNCATVSGDQGQEACELTAFGFDNGAASYLASIEANPTVSSVLDHAAEAAASALTAVSVPSGLTGSAFVQYYISNYIAGVSALPSNEQAIVTSVLGAAAALQSGSASPAATGSSSGSSGAGATSVSSHAGAAPAVQTMAIGMMAGAMAGVAGLAMAL